ncbi:MAG TPA: hypothetical protein VIF82_00060 [Burkholderiaceae bacterium]|jgi:hypothetical protein
MTASWIIFVGQLYTALQHYFHLAFNGLSFSKKENKKRKLTKIRKTSHGKRSRWESGKAKDMY